jgi:hypothetical protein
MKTSCHPMSTVQDENEIAVACYQGLFKNLHKIMVNPKKQMGSILDIKRAQKSWHVCHGNEFVIER